MPSARSSAAGPTPESFSNCGELIAPPHRITSRRAPPVQFAPALAVAHADGAAALENDLRRSRVSDDAKVRALHRRLQIGVGGGPAHAVFDRHVEAAETLLPFAVEVGADGIAGLPARLDEGVVQRIAPRAAPRRERAVGAAIGVGARPPSPRRA